MPRKFFLLSLIATFLVTSSGCVQQLRYNIKQVQSDVFGLNREVVIYSIDGKPIKTIDGKFKVLYPSGNRMEFVKEDGKKITVSGLYTSIIEEK
jgi:outer membrane lipoprotein-sorting protein